MSNERVLFICIENAGRSLMAEASFNADPAPGWTAISAGTRPASTANPRTVRMLREVGLDVPAHPPQMLTQAMMDESRVRITMGCLDDASCPAHLKTLESIDWNLPNPATMDDPGFRRVRDDIRERVGRLRTELILRDRQRAERRSPR